MSFMKSPREVTPVSNEHGNDHDVKNLKKSFHLSVLWILLLLVVFTGSTYAWFTLSGLSSTNVTPMAGTIGIGDTVLLISNSSNGPFDKSCELVLDGNPTSLKPISTANLQNFYKGTTQTKEGITVLYASADSEVNQDAIHGTVYLQCQNAACDVYFEPQNLNLGSNAQALAAMLPWLEDHLFHRNPESDFQTGCSWKHRQCTVQDHHIQKLRGCFLCDFSRRAHLRG